jgi:hypothetical protein
MKKFLALTLVLFLSLFIVGESGATHSGKSGMKYIANNHNIITGGEIISSNYFDQRDLEQFNLLIRFQGELWWCKTFLLGPAGAEAEPGHYCYLYPEYLGVEFK